MSTDVGQVAAGMQGTRGLGEEDGRRKDATRRPEGCTGRLLSVRQMYEEVPQPQWVVDGILPSNTVNLLTGESQSGKSFWAVDWAACAACDVPWEGRKVKPGPVVYLVTEDEDDFPRRLRAWEREHGVSLEDKPSHFGPDGVHLLRDRDVDSLLEDIKALPEPPVLVVIDTLGKAIVEGNRSDDGEKDNTEINRALLAAERIRRATKAAVLLIHHPTKGGAVRGGSALEQGVRMSAVLSGRADDGASVTLTCRKLKSGKFAPITRKAREIGLENGERALVFFCGEGQAPEKATKRVDRQLSKPAKTRISKEAVYRALAESSGGLTPKQLAGMLGTSRNSIQQHLKQLSAEGRVTTDGDGTYWAVTRRAV